MGVKDCTQPRTPHGDTRTRVQPSPGEVLEFSVRCAKCALVLLRPRFDEDAHDVPASLEIVVHQTAQQRDPRAPEPDEEVPSGYYRAVCPSKRAVREWTNPCHRMLIGVCVCVRVNVDC